MRSFQAKLVYLTVAALVLLQAATLIAVHVANQRTMRTSIADELRVGSRVLDRTLEARGQQLSDSVRVLASDFPFRETIATGDRPSIVDVLQNHGRRINADATFLIGLDGIVSAETLGDRFTGKRFPFPSLVAEAQQRGEATAIVTFDERPYQLALVPVLAPRPIAWVCMGFAIDDAVLNDVRRLTSLDVSLWSLSERPLMISTLRQNDRNDLAARVRALSRGGDHDETIELGSEAYQGLVHPLQTADESKIQTLLQRSVEEAQRPYRQLELQIFALSTMALVAAVFAAIYFARSVSSPLEHLAQEAQRIERGD